MIGVEDGRGHEVGWAAERERDCRRTENQDKGECRGRREGGGVRGGEAESGGEAQTEAAAGGKSSKKVHNFWSSLKERPGRRL